MSDIPLNVLAHAKEAKGNPIAWSKDAKYPLTIVFEDGRKLVFDKPKTEQVAPQARPKASKKAN